MTLCKPVLVTFISVLSCLFPVMGMAAGSGEVATPNATSLRVTVMGDSGIGERAFHAGFLAVQKAMTQMEPDLLLHLGDFVYQPEKFPTTCPAKYIEEIRRTLVEPFPLKIFVPGDNDLPPKPGKPKASGCWNKIDPLDTPLAKVAEGDPKPGPFEGTLTINSVFFAVLNAYPYQDPTEWLAPKIALAKKEGHWIVIAIHEPAITTAWFLDKRQTVLKQLNSLGADLVLSGNQHSYERFHPIGIPEPDGTFPTTRVENSVYPRGAGTLHVISGGGGALFKPFADLQGKTERTAPKEVFDALKTRALMNHFVLLEFSNDRVKGTSYRVCAGMEAEQQKNPRWKPKKPAWGNIALECDSQPAGTEPFDQFEIVR